MNAYFTITETSLRRRPSLFPGARAARSPGAHITAVDISTESLASASRRVAAAGIDTVTFAQADVISLVHEHGALAVETFDHVFVCFLLEHLPRPVEALTRLRSMLKPSGSLTVIEGDHGSTYFHPDSDAAHDAIDCQVTLQRHAGGDALIGRRLYPLLAEAGCHDVRGVSPDGLRRRQPPRARRRVHPQDFHRHD